MKTLFTIFTMLFFANFSSAQSKSHSFAIEQDLDDILRFPYEGLKGDPYEGCRRVYVQEISDVILFSPRKLQHCLNQWIDLNLTPICKYEEKLYTLLDQYRRKRTSYEILKAIENEIYYNEEQKYDVVNVVYNIADNFNALCTHMADKAARELRRKKHESLELEWLEVSVQEVQKEECQSVARSIGYKVRTVCHKIDFSKINKSR